MEAVIFVGLQAAGKTCYTCRTYVRINRNDRYGYGRLPIVSAP
jgi:hypothetical protein